MPPSQPPPGRGAGGERTPTSTAAGAEPEPFGPPPSFITPGSSTRGARRVVTGEEYQEDYYTADHYASFDLIDYGC